MLGLIMSVNENRNDRLYEIDAAESFVIVYRGESLAGVYWGVRSFAYNRHDCGV